MGTAGAAAGTGAQGGSGRQTFLDVGNDLVGGVGKKSVRRRCGRGVKAVSRRISPTTKISRPISGQAHY